MNKLLRTLTTLLTLLIATAGHAQGKVYTETELKVQLPFGKANSTESSQTYTVERVIDGNTLKLTNGERVRLIGIDTLESKPNNKAKRDSERTGQDVETINKMGEKATLHLNETIDLNMGSIYYGYDKLIIMYDVQRLDKYGRTLAYVYMNTGYTIDAGWDYPKPCYKGFNGFHWVMLNCKMIKDGYATPMTIPPNVKLTCPT